MVLPVPSSSHDHLLPLKKRRFHPPPQTTPLDLRVRKPDVHDATEGISPTNRPLTWPALPPLLRHQAPKQDSGTNFPAQMWPANRPSFTLPSPFLPCSPRLCHPTLFRLVSGPPPAEPPPKYFMSAFAHFMAYRRKQLKEEGKCILRLTQWVKEVAEFWRHMCPEAQRPFRDIALDDRLRYYGEYEQWKTRMLNAGHNIKDLSKAKRKGNGRKSKQAAA